MILHGLLFNGNFYKKASCVTFPECVSQEKIIQSLLSNLFCRPIRYWKIEFLFHEYRQYTDVWK